MPVLRLLGRLGAFFRRGGLGFFGLLGDFDLAEFFGGAKSAEDVGERYGLELTGDEVADFERGLFLAEQDVVLRDHVLRGFGDGGLHAARSS